MGGDDARAGHQTADVSGRHEKQLVAGKAHDFRFDLFALRGVDQAASAHRGLAAHGLQRHANHAIERAFDHEFGGARHSLARLHERLNPSLGAQLRGLDAQVVAPRGVVAWRSVPINSLKMLPRRVSKRASMREVLVVTWQPPRAMTGSSTMVQARSFSVGARCCLTTVASSGCKCTRTSRVATGNAAIASRMMPMIYVGSVFSSRRTICRAKAMARVSSSRSTSASSASNGLARS